MSRPDVTTSTVCPCIDTPLHRRAVTASVEVVWTDAPGCHCLPGVNLPAADTDGADQTLALSTDLGEAAALMRRIEATAPGSAERAAIHDEGCVSHECAEVTR